MKSRPTHTLGVDIGGSHITAVVVDARTGKLVESSRHHASVDSNADADTILNEWCAAMVQARGGFPIGAMGIAMPGPFDYQNGISLIQGLTKFEALYGMNIRHELKQRLGLPASFPVIFRNDAACFLVGEHQFGAARGASRAIGITIGTGLGSAFIADGQLVESGPSVPLHGWIYCLPYGDGMAEETFSSRGLVARAHSPAVQNVKDLARAARSLPDSLMLFENWGSDLADFLSPIVSAFRPGCVVIGGNVSLAWEYFSPLLLRSFKARHPAVKVVPSTLLEDAALIGAAGLPLLFSEPVTP